MMRRYWLGTEDGEKHYGDCATRRVAMAAARGFALAAGEGQLAALWTVTVLVMDTCARAGQPNAWRGRAPRVHLRQ